MREIYRMPESGCSVYIPWNMFVQSQPGAEKAKLIIPTLVEINNGKIDCWETGDVFKWLTNVGETANRIFQFRWANNSEMPNLFLTRQPDVLF